MRRFLACLVTAVFAALAFARAPAGAMTMSVNGQQLIATGNVELEDAGRFRALVVAHPEVTVVVLHDSPGGASLADDAIAATIEARALDTVVSGYCVSACAMIFLAGAKRSVGDLDPLERTSLGFHGSYVRGTLGGEKRLALLKDRVLRRTGGKIDPALVDRWLHLPDRRSTIRFRYPPADAATPSVYYCTAGRGANAGDFAACEPLPAGDAVTSGILTSADVVHVNR